MALGLAGPALASTTATVTVGGSEQQINGAWDQGTITIAFNGYVESVSYGQFSSQASVAAALAGMFTRDYAPDGLSAKANCPPNGSQIIFTLQGTTPFGTLDIQGPTTSFSFSASGFQSSSSIVADYGTVTLTVNGVTAAQTNYGDGATPASIAEGLAAGVKSNSPVNVTAANGEVDLQSKTGGSSTNYSYTLQTTSYNSSTFSQPSFMNPAASGSLSGGADPNTTGATIYSYSIPNPATSTQGYNPNGTILGYSDSVMGSWSFTYDNLNRLATAVVTPAVDSDTYFCWSYDAFGNRLQQMGSNESITGGGSSTCTQQSGSNVNLAWANYSSANNNRMTTTVQAPGGVSYDAAGDITNDGHVSYLYNADGQICAVQTTYESMTIMYGYIYDADGNRVAKGTITSWSCDPSANGFVATANYVLDQSGHQLSRFAPDSNGNIVLDYTNVWAAGALMATYDGDNLHFYLNDWLGTRRVQTNYSGVVEQDCMSLPYGDSETCGPTPAENLYTGKERDSESGNDYFGARYYASTMGRFLSPDPSTLEYADPTNPQSFNLYSYVQNNPLVNVDPTGLDCVYFNDAGDSIESVDRNSNSGECGQNGGDWINGTVQNAMYFADSDTWGFRSSDSSNNYLTYANAPGTESDGTTCAGNCDTVNGYFQSSNAAPGLFDIPQDQRIQQIAIGVTADSQHSFGCIAQAYGVGAPGESARYMGQPVPGTKRFVSPGSSLGTSPISEALSDALPIKGSFRAPVGGPGTGVPFRMTKTGNLGRAIGRYAPFVGLAADAYAAGQLWNCLGGH